MRRGKLSKVQSSSRHRASARVRPARAKVHELHQGPTEIHREVSHVVALPRQRDRGRFGLARRRRVAQGRARTGRVGGVSRVRSVALSRWVDRGVGYVDAQGRAEAAVARVTDIARSGPSRGLGVGHRGRGVRRGRGDREPANPRRPDARRARERRRTRRERSENDAIFYSFGVVVSFARFAGVVGTPSAARRRRLDVGYPPAS